MKKLLFTLLLVWGCLYSHAQQILNLQTGILDAGVAPTVPTRDVVQLVDGYLVTYNFSKALIQQDNLFSGTVFWKMDGMGLNQTPGEPSTLMRNDLYAIPAGHSARIEMVDSTFIDYHYELTPARQPLWNSSNENYTKQNVLPVKPYDGFRPLNIATITATESYRGQKISQATMSPIQYNHNTKTVRAYTSITYKVKFVPELTEVSILTAGQTEETLSPNISAEDNFLANNVIGGNRKEKNGMKANGNAMSDVRDYLILTTPAYSAAAERFRAWKRLMGFNVHLIVHNHWTSDIVKNTVSNMYTRYPSLYYLLIIGDHKDVPAQQVSFVNPHITDFRYCCIENDYIPEIYGGRLSVSTLTEAMTVVNKIINYEKTPPTDFRFYMEGSHCAYFQDYDNDHYEDARFTQTSEDVRNYVMSQGKIIQRVYTTERNVIPLYWNHDKFSSGESIPPELIKPGFEWNGNSTDITIAINNGRFYVLHRDHGDVDKWEAPQFTQQDIANLTNGNLQPVVFSINCLTGKFDENCFAETFLRKANGGCVAIYAATKESYMGYNDALTGGMFDAIWPDPGLYIKIPKTFDTISETPAPTYRLGQILNQGKARLSDTYGLVNGLTIYTKDIFHCFGDPSMMMYTEKPKPFTNVSVIRNTHSITINTGENQPARITVYDPATDKTNSYIGISATVNVVNPYKVYVCVSAHNRIPFIKNPDIKYIQNTNITGTMDETHDLIMVGNHVTNTVEAGDVTTSNADITLKAEKVVFDGGTHISEGTVLKVNHP